MKITALKYYLGQNKGMPFRIIFAIFGSARHNTKYQDKYKR